MCVCVCVCVDKCTKTSVGAFLADCLSRVIGPAGDKTFKVDTRPHGNFSNTPVATVVQSYEKGNHVSEPTFIPRPGATQEDDGVLLLHEYVPGPGNASATNECEKEGCTHTVVLDAQTFKTLARMPLGFAVPAPLHAAFFPDYE